MTDREKALEAFGNIATALQAECGYSKWFPDWVKAPQYPMMFTRENYKVALDEIRSALSSPSFDDAVEVVEDFKKSFDYTATATAKQGFYQEDNIVRLELERLLTALRERGKGK